MINLLNSNLALMSTFIAVLGTAATFYWKLMDRPQKLLERQNETFRNVLNDEELCSKEDKGLELEIVFRYCFNYTLKAHEVRYLLRKSIPLADLEIYSRLSRSNILEVTNEDKISFVGHFKNKWWRRTVVAIWFLFAFFFLFFAGVLIFTLQSRNLEPAQNLANFTSALFLLCAVFFYANQAKKILQGQRLTEYNNGARS